uniref:SMP-30/Gluconolactonase/LRE-like region domain-containing protein n=1 Tax=Branchiostoma floridae TaxID=7739 RepID=C3YDK7_BRAFL|eukprot:XP_002605808.1 hypothetical protein BRAFLDRAFT_84413 [Branchiostoma floridae]
MDDRLQPDSASNPATNEYLKTGVTQPSSGAETMETIIGQVDNDGDSSVAKRYICTEHDDGGMDIAAGEEQQRQTFLKQTTVVDVQLESYADNCRDDMAVSMTGQEEEITECDVSDREDGYPAPVRDNNDMGDIQCTSSPLERHSKCKEDAPNSYHMSFAPLNKNCTKIADPNPAMYARNVQYANSKYQKNVCDPNEMYGSDIPPEPYRDGKCQENVEVSNDLPTTSDTVGTNIETADIAASFSDVLNESKVDPEPAHRSAHVYCNDSTTTSTVSAADRQIHHRDAGDANVEAPAVSSVTQNPPHKPNVRTTSYIKPYAVRYQEDGANNMPSAERNDAAERNKTESTTPEDNIQPYAVAYMSHYDAAYIIRAGSGEAGTLSTSMKTNNNANSNNDTAADLSACNSPENDVGNDSNARYLPTNLQSNPTVIADPTSMRNALGANPMYAPNVHLNEAYAESVGDNVKSEITIRKEGFNPAKVAVSADNEIFVTDSCSFTCMGVSNEGRVQVFNMNGVFLRLFKTAVPGINDVMAANDLAFDGKGFLWVVGMIDYVQVVQYSREGLPMAKIGVKVAAFNPAIAVDTRNNDDPPF